jgi:hypothetical protein
VFLLWVIWYNYAKLSFTTNFEPITNQIDKSETLPLTNSSIINGSSNSISSLIIVDIILIIVFVTWRVLFYHKPWKHSKIPQKTKVAFLFLSFLFLLLFVCLTTMFRVKTTVTSKESAPPEKIETSMDIYDVQSKEDLLKFTTEQMRELIKRENDRNKSKTKTPHPVLVYCFEERSFQYTGGKHENSEIKYRLHVPQKIKPYKKYPLVVHLHDVGEAGTDNTFSLAHLHAILPLMVGEKQQDFFLLVLQCPPNDKLWNFKPEKDGNLDVVVALTDHVIQNNPIDEKRLSLFGLSSGGYGVWRWLLKYPDKFAAAVPVSCSVPHNFQKIVALKQTPIWTFKNQADTKVLVEFIHKAMRIINDSGGFMKLTQFDQGGHVAWRPAMEMCNCFGWMIAQKRGGWFNPPPERNIYTYRSLSNCFFAFFLPLLLATGIQVFQRTKYCEQFHERITKKPYYKPSAKEKNNDNSNSNDKANDVTKCFYTWTDNTGTKKLKLKLIDVKNGDARFERQDSNIIVTNIIHFCLEDQRILKSYNQQVPDNQFRIWTDISGTQKFEAKLIGVQTNLVLFQSKTGDTGTMNINSLSETDQKLIRQFLEQK